MVPNVVDCNLLELTTGTAMVQQVSLIRDWLDAGQPVHLLDPPQLLVHNLYRIGRYPHALLTLEGVGDAEAYG